MPAIAAAALARIRAETELSPATSVTAGISVDVADVDVGAGVAGGHGRDHQLGHARPAARASPRSRSRCCPSRRRRARPGSAPRRTAGGRRPARPRTSPPRRAPAVGQGGEVEPAGGGHLLARHVGRGARRPLRADVDQQGGDPGLLAAGRGGTRTRRPWCRACRRGRRSDWSLADWVHWLLAATGGVLDVPGHMVTCLIDYRFPRKGAKGSVR